VTELPHTTFTPWLRRDQWALLCSVYADPDELPPSYDDWLRDAQGGLVAFTEAGYNVQRVDVDVEQWTLWCRRHRRRLDAAALMHFSIKRGAS
jgi:hypothetical protein